MRIFWQKCTGQTVDGFPLLQYLSGDEDHAVFRTDAVTHSKRKAVIKLFRRDPEIVEDQLRRWRQVSELSHPNLMRLFERGSWKLDEIPVVYVLMEYADEDLSQVIPDRALSVEEAREMLEPALDALAYLHSNGFVHGHVKPSNFMAIDSRLKLSSDCIEPMGPGKATPADDVWSLGMTLVEVLTQHRPASNGTREPMLPASFPADFREVASNALRRDPLKRPPASELQLQLRGGPQPQRKSPRGTALAVAAVILLVLVAGTLFIRKRDQPPKQSTVQQPAAVQSVQPAKPAPALVAPPKTPAETPPKTIEPKPALTAPPQDEIVRRVMPDVFPSARNTIQGKVANRVRVTVDPSGDVSDATLESPGPSVYFSGAAMKAARQWKFAPADRPRAWILRFEFTRAGTKITPVKATP
jgi:TonB family protein